MCRYLVCHQVNGSDKKFGLSILWKYAPFLCLNRSLFSLQVIRRVRNHVVWHLYEVATIIVISRTSIHVHIIYALDFGSSGHLQTISLHFLASENNSVSGIWRGLVCNLCIALCNLLMLDLRFQHGGQVLALSGSFLWNYELICCKSGHVCSVFTPSAIKRLQ